MEHIGKIVATEKQPTTIDDFSFWTRKDQKLKPFDVVVVDHIQNSKTFGVVEEISHITDSPSALSGYISNDFGDVESQSYTQRLGMNYVRCKVVGNTENIYTPVQEGRSVSLASEDEIKEALGLNDVENPLPAGYIEMYDGDNKQTIPVHFNSKFLIGPEGAHLNISGISGLASKTSYAMFLMKAIQDIAINGYKKSENKEKPSVAFVMLNVKGKDLLAVDKLNDNKDEINEIKPIYESLNLELKPFQNVKYFYPFSKSITSTTYEDVEIVKQRLGVNAFQYKYLFDTDDDKECLDLLFANVDDPNETIDSIINEIVSQNGQFANIGNWEDFQKALKEQTEAGKAKDKQISVLSWRKFYRLFNKSYEKNKDMFTNSLGDEKKYVQLRDAISKIKKDDVFVIDVAKLDEDAQGFVFGDVMRAVYNLKLGSTDRDESDIPERIVIFIDELNKYASNDVPKTSPILRQLLDITERGRSLGIVLFGAEQFVSDIHKRVKGNCATQAFGRTNAIEISKEDFRFVPPVYKTMLTRLKQGEYIIQNPIFRSMLNIKFPKPIYKQYK